MQLHPAAPELVALGITGLRRAAPPRRAALSPASAAPPVAATVTTRPSTLGQLQEAPGQVATGITHPSSPRDQDCAALVPVQQALTTVEGQVCAAPNQEVSGIMAGGPAALHPISAALSDKLRRRLPVPLATLPHLVAALGSWHRPARASLPRYNS